MQQGAAFGITAMLTLGLVQTQESDRPSFSSASTDLVVPPITVADKQGRLVADLAGYRFVIYDNERPQSITLISNEDTPVAIALVIDDSGSMGSKLGEVVAAALAFARSSNPDDERFVIDFNDSVRDA